MNSVLARVLIRLYPRAWRERPALWARPVQRE